MSRKWREMTQHADSAKDGRRAIRAVCHAMACGVVLSVCVLMIVAYVFETSARAEGYAGEAVVFCSARWALLINGGIAVLGLVFLVWCLVLNRQVAKKTIALEQSNRNSEFNFRRLIDGMPDAVFIQTDGQLTYANPVACALLGASTPDELLGAPVLGFFPKTKHAYITERIAQLDAGSGYTPAVEHTLLRLDGTRITV